MSDESAIDLLERFRKLTASIPVTEEQVATAIKKRKKAKPVKPAFPNFVWPPGFQIDVLRSGLLYALSRQAQSRLGHFYAAKGVVRKKVVLR